MNDKLKHLNFHRLQQIMSIYKDNKHSPKVIQGMAHEVCCCETGKVNGKREQNQRSFISSKWEFHTERKRQDRRVLSECQGSLKHRLYFYFQFYNTKGTVTIHTFQQFFRKVKWAVVQQISVCSTIFEIIDALFCKWPFSHKLHYVKQERERGILPIEVIFLFFFCSDF